jgi:hypothetical protein
VILCIDPNKTIKAVKFQKVGIIIEDGGGVALNIWVFVEVFLSTLWAGIAAAMLLTAIAFLAVHLVTGERMHDKVGSFSQCLTFDAPLLVLLQNCFS